MKNEKRIYSCPMAWILGVWMISIGFANPGKVPTTTVVISPGVQVEAELAYTDEARMKGLMFRTSLAQDAGMLFLFTELERQEFWMKNTLIPLDIVWLNERKEIVYFVTASPCKKDPCFSYTPLQKAKYVLEVNSGFAKRHHLKIGDRLEFIIPEGLEKEKS